MNILKYGHSCFLVEEAGKRFLFDPGTYSVGQNEATNLDAVIITHAHPDHLDLDSLKAIVARNPQAQIITNSEVAEKLSAENLQSLMVGDGQKVEIGGVEVEGVGVEHGLIYAGVSLPHNTGYFIANKFFYPGDFLFLPEKPVEVLALPVVAPWLNIAQVLDYAKAVNPKACFPVHDGALRPDRIGPYHKLPETFLSQESIRFTPLKEGESAEF